MIARERIGLWLREVGGAYCDDCIAKELRLSHRHVNRSTNTLSRMSNFYRERGVCSLCGMVKNVIEVV